MTDKIVDASSLINLYASGKLEVVLPSCGGTFYVPDQVRNEAQSIRQPDEHDPSLLVSTPIDLNSAIAEGLIQECQLNGDAELESYVQFAALVDDGEASCLAIAKSRGWIVATDDRKAIRIATEAGIAVVTTPELVERWATACHATSAEVSDVLIRIERFARFRPRGDSPFFSWWESHVGRQ